MTICFTKHALPLRPKNLALKEITAAHLRKVLNPITDDGILANSTIIKVLNNMTTPLREAYLKEIILRALTRTLDPNDKSGKEKGILTPREFSQLITWMRDNIPLHIINDPVQDAEGQYYSVITVVCEACGTVISSQAIPMEK